MTNESEGSGFAVLCANCNKIIEETRTICPSESNLNKNVAIIHMNGLAAQMRIYCAFKC